MVGFSRQELYYLLVMLIVPDASALLCYRDYRSGACKGNQT